MAGQCGHPPARQSLYGALGTNAAQGQGNTGSLVEKITCPHLQHYVATKIEFRKEKQVPLPFWSLCDGVPAVDPPSPPHLTLPRSQEVLIHLLVQIFPPGRLF